MIWLWRYIFGFLNITLYGENAERILNIAAKNNINLWNLSCKKGTITGNIGIKSFIKLRYVKRGVKCKIKINQKRGLVFHTKKYINRTGFFLGVFLFIVILTLLSNFIWVIKIEGNKNIPDSEIIESCKAIGIYEGMYKKRINTKYDSQRLLLMQNGVSWGFFNISGSVLTLNLSESEFSDTSEHEIPTNIKASYDGKISKIDVTSGEVTVKVGDIVSKGDLLVSGISERNSSKLFLHSEGVIIAQTKRTFSASGDFIQKVRTNTERVKNHYTVEFFKLKIPLYVGSVKGDYNYTCKVKNLKLFGNRIPIKAATEKYTFIEETTVNYSKSELEKILLENIENQVESSNLISKTEADREIKITDSGMLINITYLCEENIALSEKIILNTQN